MLAYEHRRLHIPPDMVWAAPRRFADRALALATAHRDCESPGACCDDRMEFLLEFATRGVPIQHDEKLWRRISSGSSLLRGAQGACELITSSCNAGKAARAFISSRERIGTTLPVSAAVRLRTMFGGDLPACRQALWAEPCDALATHLNQTCQGGGGIPLATKKEYACYRGRQQVPAALLHDARSTV